MKELIQFTQNAGLTLLGVGLIAGLFLAAIVAGVLSWQSERVRKMMDAEDAALAAHRTSPAETDEEIRRRLAAVYPSDGIESDGFGYE
jgi:Tfp pilus assembly protein PilV